MMTRVAVVILMVSLAACRAEAAREDVPHAGSWGLEFQVQPKSGSSQYGIATKYHLGDRTAARMGFLVSLGSSDGDTFNQSDRTTPYDSSGTTSRGGIESDDRSGSVFLHISRYTTVAEHFGLSLDVGPVFVWNRSKLTQTNLAATHDFVTYESDRKSYGLELQAGFEWHFVRRLSLAGRYGLSTLRNEGTQTSSRHITAPEDLFRSHIETARTEDGFTVQTTSSVFSLIAYW